MKTREEAEEVLGELLNQLNVLKQFLDFEIERDDACDGAAYYISIRKKGKN